MKLNKRGAIFESVAFYYAVTFATIVLGMHTSGLYPEKFGKDGSKAVHGREYATCDFGVKPCEISDLALHNYKGE